jgi:hypothetical protein
MATGIIIMPIGGSRQERIKLFEALLKKDDFTYVGLNDIKEVSGNDSLKANVIISNLKTFISLSRKFIFFDCDNQTSSQRKLIIDLAVKSNYSVFGLMLDNPKYNSIIGKDNAFWDEGFKEIIYL